jgi:hypothetical protein
MPACNAGKRGSILGRDMSVSGSSLEDGHTIIFTRGLSPSPWKKIDTVRKENEHEFLSAVCRAQVNKNTFEIFNDLLTLRQAWKGSCSSDPLMTMLGKSRRWTSRGSNIPFRVTMICLGCSSTGSERIRAATLTGQNIYAILNEKLIISMLWGS